MENEFFKKLKGKKTRLIIGLIIIIVCLMAEVLLYMKKDNDIKSAKSLIEVEMDNGGSAEKYSYIDVKLMSDYFATYTYDESVEYLYFVWDDKYTYVASLSTAERQKLNDIYEYTYNSNENTPKPKSVRIYGYTKLIPEDLKKITADSYNELYGVTEYTEANITNYVGIYYLDTESTPTGNFITYSIIIGIISLIGFYQIYAYFRNKKKMTKIMNTYSLELDKIKSEMDNGDTLYSKKAKIYLTKNYIVSLVNGFEIYKYKDIRWIYPHENRYNGILANISIMIVTKDSKTHTIANINYNKKNGIKFDEIYATLRNRVPDALQGYTSENIEKNKNYMQSKNNS